MQDIPAERKKREPSSLVLQEIIRQAPEEYVTVGWLTSTLHRHSFGIIMLSLGLLATTPVGSSIPGLILAVSIVRCRCDMHPLRRLRRGGSRVDPHDIFRQADRECRSRK